MKSQKRRATLVQRKKASPPIKGENPTHGFRRGARIEETRKPGGPKTFVRKGPEPEDFNVKGRSVFALPDPILESEE